jgi:hypothetical protein
MSVIDHRSRWLLDPEPQLRPAPCNDCVVVSARVLDLAIAALEPLADLIRDPNLAGLPAETVVGVLMRKAAFAAAQDARAKLMEGLAHG